MIKERILPLLKQKESQKLEFKEAKRDVPASLFETVCAFLNRDGGDIFLGVHDSGAIVGIDESVIDKMMTDIITKSNNPEVLDPPFILFPEKIEVEGRWILYIQVPESSSVSRCKGVVYDRGADGDFRLKEPERIAALSNKKKGFYSEARVYRYLEIADLDAALFNKTRNRLYSKNPEHPWLPLSDEEMLVRAGLIKKDRETGIKGLTLAAALLFGKEETIQAIIPQYKVDILVKRQDLARYDDRLDIRSNLLEAYPAIMSFLERYLPDPFYMEKDVRLSLREKIFREAVANLLVHREYLHQFPARIIITRGQVEFTNPCNPVYFGNIDDYDYHPNQKNPLISKFFLQLGWVEEIGSGIYNIKKYLPFYTPGRRASFNEDIVFTTIIPIPTTEDLQNRQTPPHDTPHVTPHVTMQDKASIHDVLQDADQLTDQATMQATMQVTMQVQKILEVCIEEKNREELQYAVGLKNRDYFRKEYLNPAVEAGLLALAIPDKPNSSKQRYRLTEKGKTFLKNMQVTPQFTPHVTPHVTVTPQVTMQDKASIHDDLQDSDQVTMQVTPQVTMQATMQVTMQVQKILEACIEEKNREELQYAVGLKNRDYFRKEYLNPAVEAGLLALTIPDKPNSSKQRYRLTEKGKAYLKNRIKKHE